MDPNTTNTASRLASWSSDHNNISYQGHGDDCYDLVLSEHEGTSNAVSYNYFVNSSAATHATTTSSTSLFVEGVPHVFCENPISVGPPWPSYYAGGPQVSANTNQQQQVFYDQASIAFSGSSMPPTPPDVSPNALPFAAGPLPCNFQYQCHQDQDYSNIAVNKDISNNNNDNNTKSCDDSFACTTTKHRKTRRSSEKHKEKKKCSNCGSTKTPTWRRGPITKALLCNACGLYEKVSKKRRIVIVQTDGKTKISRGALNQLKYEQEQQGDMTRTCLQCHTTNAKRWYEQRNRNYYHRSNSDRCIRTTTSKL
ncbi:hypothetical protein INT45_007649 [Circinella minor]|uniref:GATA-type domain-containing protein n=1 Tax=Circinella minor TaxID=1195481 RepID=A0A8H7RXB7_9FUNG|nr:hypothetical protein INT45_007649 [Circinella minor]